MTMKQCSGNVPKRSFLGVIGLLWVVMAWLSFTEIKRRTVSRWGLLQC
jgi:hypothetical protein